MMGRGKKILRGASGFTLLETMVSLLVLTIIVGAIFMQLQKAQANYKVEGEKLDLAQQDREFIDQFTRDLHQAGYPSPASLNINNLNSGVDPAGGNPNLISAGITQISSTSLTMEGDLDGTGVVKVVNYKFSPGAGCPGAVPCVLRTVTVKGVAGAGTAYVEVQNLVANSGAFTALDNQGQAVGLPQTLNANATINDTSYKNLRKIKAVNVSLTLQSIGRDVNGGAAPQVTMTGTARLPND
jgi:type II secretory pathway pseudopilin PulG